jgi:predicted RND superfamily exporter protein
MKKKLFDLIISHRLLVSIGLLGITIFFGWHAARITINTNIENFYLKDDVGNYNRFLNEFGTDQVIAIAFETEEPFSPDNLRVIDSISEKLEALPHVRRVYSLTTAKVIYGEDDVIHFVDLMEEIPPAGEELAGIKQRALDDPFIPGILMSPETKNTAIVAEIEHVIGESYNDEIELARTIKEILKEEEERNGIHFYLGGNIVIEEALSRYTQVDNMRMVLLSALFMLVVTYIMFRQIVMTILPMLVVMLTLIWTHGLMVLLGFEVNTINIIIRALLMAVATAGSMHIIADYLQKGAAGKHTKVEYLRQTFGDVATPCFMAAITTAIGLLSLLTSDIEPLREFGLTGAAGVMCSFIISIFLLPILLSIIPVPKGAYRERIEKGFLTKALIWLGHWRKRRAIIIITIAFAAVIPALLSLPMNVVGTNTIRYLRKNDDIRKQIEWLDSSISGTSSLEFMIDGGRENAFKDPSLLRKVEGFQDYLEGIDGVTEVYSAVDLVKALNRAFHGGREEQFSIPTSYSEVTQQLFIIETGRCPK